MRGLQGVRERLADAPKASELNPHRQDHRFDPFLLQAALDRGGGLVVQYPVGELLQGKDGLARTRKDGKSHLKGYPPTYLLTPCYGVSSAPSNRIQLPVRVAPRNQVVSIINKNLI